MKVYKQRSIFAQRLSECRKARGWTAEELAKQMGVSHSSVANWELDYFQPRIDVLVMLAKLFNVSTDWLLGLEEAE